MIEVAVKLFKAVVGGQVLVQIAQMVFTKLPGGIALFLQDFCQGQIFRAEAEVNPRQAHLGQACAGRTLASDEGGPSSGTAILGVGIGEQDALVGNTVDVGGAVAHHAPVIGADVEPTDVIPHDHQNIRGRRGCRERLGAAK